MGADRAQPVVVPPDSGKVLAFLGVTHKLTHSQTSGAYYLFEAEFDPESGNRLHVHRYEDEVVHVLEGELQVRLHTRTLQVQAGGVAHLPKHIHHALYNPLKKPLRILAIAVPGGLESFFDDLVSAQENGSLDEAGHKSISRKYEIENGIGPQYAWSKGRIPASGPTLGASFSGAGNIGRECRT